MTEMPMNHNQMDWPNLKRSINQKPVVTQRPICWDNNYGKELELLQNTANQGELQNLQHMSIFFP